MVLPGDGCGGNGVTYDNQCKLKREACLKETDITIVEKAPCSKSIQVAKIQKDGQVGTVYTHLLDLWV